MHVAQNRQHFIPLAIAIINEQILKVLQEFHKEEVEDSDRQLEIGCALVHPNGHEESKDGESHRHLFAETHDCCGSHVHKAERC